MKAARSLAGTSDLALTLEDFLGEKKMRAFDLCS